MIVPDGNDALRVDLTAIVKLIEDTCRWVSPDTFKSLPIWAPHAARGRPLYDATWTRPYTNTRRATNVTSEKSEGNVTALNSLVAALGVQRPKPKNWTVCHIWGYDDATFSQRSNIVQDPRYFSCIANMVWLPTTLKGFTDAMPEIKSVLRVCAFHMYGWACEHPDVTSDAIKIQAGWKPEIYPVSWPCADRRCLLPIGTAPFSARIKAEVLKRKNKFRADLGNSGLKHYPRTEVQQVLKFWNVNLDN